MRVVQIYVSLLISLFYSSGQQSPQYYAGMDFSCMLLHFHLFWALLSFHLYMIKLCLSKSFATGPGGQPVTSMGGYMINPQFQHIHQQGQPGHLPLHMQPQQPPPQQLKLFTQRANLFPLIFEQKHNYCELLFKAIFNPAPSTAAAATVEPVRWVLTF